MTDKQKQYIIDQTLVFIKELTAEGMYEKDVSEEYELSISLCYDLCITIERIEHVLLIQTTTIEKYISENGISIIR